MSIRVNGSDVELSGECTLGGFLEREGYKKGRVAVIKNGEIVPAERFDAETLSGGDILEIVSFVGGG